MHMITFEPFSKGSSTSLLFKRLCFNLIMKKIVSLLCFIFFLIFSNSLLAEVDIKLLKQKYPKCENSNYRHECFDEYFYSNVKKIGYFRNNALWDGQDFINDILIFEYISGKEIAKSFCKENEDGWTVCPSGNRFRPIEGGYFDNNNSRQGKFIFEYVSGDKYVGEFKENKSHGQGTYTHADGHKYVGEYEYGKKHGQGTYTYAIGDKYVGEWKDGKKLGQGTYTYADGSREVGTWEHGKLNGYAITYNADGSVNQEGIFKDDVFQYAQKKLSTNSNSNSKLNKYKEFCEEIGFKLGTEKFADCVLKAMEKD